MHIIKCTRAATQRIRSHTLREFAGIRPHLARQLREYNRRNPIRYTRLTPAFPTINRGRPPSPQISKKPKPITAEKFARQYERLDHLAPLNAVESPQDWLFLSDHLEPWLSTDADFDALQEEEERLRPLREQYVPVQEPYVPLHGPDEGVDDPMDIVDPDEMMGEVDTCQPPAVPDWSNDGFGGLPPPGWFLPFNCPYDWKSYINAFLPPAPKLKSPFDDIPLPSASLLLGAAPFQQPINDAPIVETAPLPAPLPAQPEQQTVANESNGLVSPVGVPQQYQPFVQACKEFAAEKLKPCQAHYVQARKHNNDPVTTAKQRQTVSSLSDYSNWPANVQVKASFYCPDPSNPEDDFPETTYLGPKRRKEEMKRFTNLQKNDPEVWEGVLGKMLQEGVTIDNLLLSHGKQAEVLQNQKWCVDNWRMDQIYAKNGMGLNIVLKEDCEKFHKAPEGKARLFYETVGYIKNHPEICYLFRITVSEWLKHEKNQETFRKIACKAGWCPRNEHQLLRDFIVYIFEHQSCSDEIYDIVEYCIPVLFPRFFQATIDEEEIDYPFPEGSRRRKSYQET